MKSHEKREKWGSSLAEIKWNGRPPHLLITIEDDRVSTSLNPIKFFCSFMAISPPYSTFFFIESSTRILLSLVDLLQLF